MAIFTRSMSSIDFTKASFRTHLNYVKCVERLLSVCKFSASKIGTPAKNISGITKFLKLYKVTFESIKKDIELAKEDPEFAVIAAPWFPVKCYYALYYLESTLVHLVDGCMYGFGKGGHAGVRKKMYHLLQDGHISFNQVDLDTIFNLIQVRNMPAINKGQNTRNDYWQRDECVKSVAKKLMDYKLHDMKSGQKWNLRTKKDQTAQKLFIANERLMLIDFFLWYRIKANYRDLDYIDFENGIDTDDVISYLTIFYQAFNRYRVELVQQISKLQK